MKQLGYHRKGWHHWIMMDHMEKGNLGTMLDASANGLESILALHLSNDILEGLEYLHAKDIVHRNLKPSNILLSFSADGTLSAKIAGRQHTPPLCSLALREIMR